MHICSILKVRLNSLKKKKKKNLWKPKINTKEQQKHENQIISVVFTNCVPWNENMPNSLTIFHSSII